MLINDAKKIDVEVKVAEPVKVSADIIVVKNPNIEQSKSETFTENGTYHITPSSGFNAMKEVEVDVNVPQLQLEEKQVTITSNGTTIVTPDNADGLSKVEVIADVPTIEGFDFSELGYSAEYSGNINEFISNDIHNLIAEGLSGNCNSKYRDKGLLFFPDIDMSDVTSMSSMFEKSTIFATCEKFNAINSTNINYLFLDCSNLRFPPKKIKVTPSKISNAIQLFYKCYNLLFIPEVDTRNAKSFDSYAQACNNAEYMPKLDTSSAENMFTAFRYCYKLKKIELTSVKNIKISTYGGLKGAFTGCSALEEVYFTEWVRDDVYLADSPNIIPSSIRYIIQNAMSVADGATARTLQLHATAYDNWVNSEYYLEDQAVMKEKDISVTKA